MAATTKLWGGRFTGATDPLMTAFNESLPYDRALHTADIIGSKAYAKAIHKSGILTDHECSELLRGLDLVEQEWLDGKFVAQEHDEDIHTANERRLGEIIGKEIAGKLHTGRSRNDQVATDMRIWTREEGRKLVGIVKELIGVMILRAEKEINVLMPGYTHLQVPSNAKTSLMKRAQPIRWSHFLCGYATFLSQDLQRLTQLLSRVNLLPLGSGALAGNPFKVDREFLAKELGFEGIIENSLVAVSDRDFVTEFLFWASLTSQHLSRLAEDLIIYGTAEFGFVQLADAYSTGSSLMPQKKNSDSLELLRGKSGRLFGHLAGFMMTVKGLPSTYNKDLQESQEPLFDTMSQINACLQITTGVMSTLTIHPQKMRRALGVEMLATDLADYLVRKGVPFRETHHISGQAVALAEQRGCGIDELTVDDFKSLSLEFESDVINVFDFEASVEARSARGGTAKESVLSQITQLRQLIENA